MFYSGPGSVPVIDDSEVSPDAPQIEVEEMLQNLTI